MFLTDAITQNPIEMPNFLLASAISIDQSNNLDLETLIGEYLIHDKDVDQDYKILSEIKETKRFKSIKEKNEKTNKNAEELSEFMVDVNQQSKEYKQQVREHFNKNITNKALSEKDIRIKNLTEQNMMLKDEIEKYKKKEIGKKTYLERMKKKKKEKRK